MPQNRGAGPGAGGPGHDGFHTRAVHGGAGHDGAASPPLVHSATFAYDTVAELIAERDRAGAGAFYQREGHPTLRAVEERLAALEGAEQALLFSSGMAAISSAFLAHARGGEKIVALRQCYGGTLEALRWGSERIGWRPELVDADRPEGWDAALEGARIFHVESPTNPTLALADLARAAEAAHRHGALLMVDNTVASPAGQRPFGWGADLVAYSATKSIGGHSDLLAGALVGPARLLEPAWKARTTFGAIADPTSAWLVDRSLKTLPLRVERANANALELARRLAADPRVDRVHYPGLPDHPAHELARRQMTLGFGPLLSFAVAGAEAAVAAVEALQVAKNAPSLGSVGTLVTLPLHTSHRRLTPEQRAAAGIPDGLVRVSVGIEDLEDLWADFDRALAAASAALPGAAGRA